MRGVAAERFCVRNSGVTAVVEVSAFFNTVTLLSISYQFSGFFRKLSFIFFVVCKLACLFVDIRRYNLVSRVLPLT